MAYQCGIGAFGAAFGSHPDEPAHYLAGLMVHDYVLSGMTQAPLEYASNYYMHLPYFAIGYWPPLFYSAEAIWMLLFGTRRATVLIFVALVAAVISFSIFNALRREMGTLAALFMGFLFLATPTILWSNASIMTDTAVTALSLAAVWAWSRYLNRERAPDALLFALLASLAILTKVSAMCVLAVPFVSLALTRRWRLLKMKAFWLWPCVVLFLQGVWLSIAWRFAGKGWEGITPPSTGRGIVLVTGALWDNLWWLTPVILIGVWRLICRLPASGEAAVYLAFPVSALLFIVTAPVDKEPRYLVSVIAGLFVVAGYGVAWLRSSMSRWAGPSTIAGILTIAALLLAGGTSWRRLHPARNDLRPIVQYVLDSKRFEGASILVPSQIEGPMIAEIAMRDRNRPSRLVCRPNKLFADMDWQGGSYRSRITTREDVLATFDEFPLDLTFLSRDSKSRWPHAELLAQTIRNDPDVWERIMPEGIDSPYEVYRYRKPHRSGKQQVLSRLDQLRQSRKLLSH